MLARRFGHAEDGLNATLAELLARRILKALGRSFPDDAAEGGPPGLTERGTAGVPST
jgi:hypothetical protein